MKFILWSTRSVASGNRILRLISSIQILICLAFSNDLSQTSQTSSAKAVRTLPGQRPGNSAIIRALLGLDYGVQFKSYLIEFYFGILNLMPCRCVCQNSSVENFQQENIPLAKFPLVKFTCQPKPIATTKVTCQNPFCTGQSTARLQPQYTVLRPDSNFKPVYSIPFNY